VDAFQPWQELKTQQRTKGERDFALPMGIDVLALHRHFRAVPEHARDHRRHFGRRTVFQLRVDANRLAFDMPVDHDAGPAVTGVPFRHQILIPGAELLRVRGAGRGAFSPELRLANLENGIGHRSSGGT